MVEKEFFCIKILEREREKFVKRVSKMPREREREREGERLAAIAPWFRLRLRSCGPGSKPLYAFFDLNC